MNGTGAESALSSQPTFVPLPRHRNSFLRCSVALSRPDFIPTIHGMDGKLLEQIRAKVAQFPKAPGVYLMKDDRGRVLYVGKAKELRARVSSYFQPGADLLNARGPDICRMVDSVVDVDFLECDTEVDALLKESRLIKDIQPPHNVQLKDGKTFPYIEITTGDDFPGVYVTRTPRPKGSKLYGPFISPTGVRDAVNALQRVFRFRTCELAILEEDESRRFFRPCLLHAIERCTAPCGALISKEDYRKDIDRLKKFMASKRSVVLRQMKREMEAASRELRFEEAATLRDRIKAIESLSLSGDVATDVQPEVFYVDPREGLDRLAELLELDAPPRCMEAIDIAHLQGEETVGSLICFIDGKPFKNGYRRFGIKSVEGVDDYGAIREVVMRRYRYAADGEELYPDVILIDGGLGQLHAALDAFDEANIRPPMIISLAKRQEEVFIQARSAPVRLPRNDPALRILQAMRDEAHRFAQHYHHMLRTKKTFDRDVKKGRRPPRNR
jgi:excinuclease ABC subunit C